MGWRRAQFKGGQVWAEVDAAGALKVTSGRVAIRYKGEAGARVYRAGASRVQVEEGGEIRDLDAGVSADAAPSRAKKSSGFGSAGTRTAQQAALAADAARSLIASLSADTIVGFTDGSCRGNPGPAGSGAVVRLPDGRRGEASRALGRGTNNVAELTAIAVALDLLEAARVDRATPIALFTDSSYTHGVLCKGWKAKANRDLILEIRRRLQTWSNLDLHWVAGHVGVDGNERADALANAGVTGVTETVWT